MHGKICSESTHEFLLKQLRMYWLVGGMPECIKVYANNQSLKLAAEVQDEICETYRLDFNKYKPKTDINCLKAVFLTYQPTEKGKGLERTTYPDTVYPRIKTRQYFSGGADLCSTAEGPMTMGSFGFGGFWDTYSWADVKGNFVAVLLLQMNPTNKFQIHEKFKDIVYGR